jgi:hypothetical protein
LRILHGYIREADGFTLRIVERHAPEEVRRKWKLRRIQLGSARSKTNFATIYRRRVNILSRANSLIRIEVKLKDKDKIAYILEKYSDSHPELFESRSLELLESCINFVTASTKKKRAAKRKQQQSWKSFLGSDIKKVNWSKLRRERLKNRNISDAEACNKSSKRLGTMLKNHVVRGTILSSKEEVIKQIADHSGLRIGESFPKM